ncbi:MAG: tetratricopeptide repeat protein [Bacteroidales bacterium]
MRLKILTPVLVFSILIHSSCNQDESMTVMPVTTDSELALEFYETAMLAFDQVKLDLAYHHLEMALKEDPDFFMAYFWMYFMSGKNSKMIVDEALMAESDLNDGEKQVKAAFKYLVDGQDEKVIEHLQMAIDLYPQDPHVHKILYILQFQYIKDAEAAVESIRRAIEACPDYALAYNQLGYALMDLEEYDKAEEAFDSYIRLSPDIANPYDSKGDFYMATRQFEKAYESYMRAYEIDSSFLVSEKKAQKAQNLLKSSL